jgi:signal transduction histidine kinase
MAAAAALAWHKARVARVVALERVRMQIATDLHDDIGSGLTRVAILSELALRELGEKQPAVAGPLDRIAELSRDLAGSMGDIVWAVNPGKDHLSDLAQRMRRYASEVFDARNITLHFKGPAEDADRRIDPEMRREVFLIFKEGVTNAVRHADCATVWIELSIEHGALVFRMRDDGRGFDPAVAAQGNGLRNMRHRARRAGGTLDIEGRPGGGVELRFTGPCRRGGRWPRTLPVLGGRRAAGGE